MRKRSSDCISDSRLSSKNTPTDAEGETYTHMLTGRDFSTRKVERATIQTTRTRNVNTVPSTPNALEDTHLARNAAEDRGSPTPVGTGKHVLQKQGYSKTTYHSAKHIKQLDYVLVSRAQQELPGKQRCAQQRCPRCTLAASRWPSHKSGPRGAMATLIQAQTVATGKRTVHAVAGAPREETRCRR